MKRGLLLGLAAVVCVFAQSENPSVYAIRNATIHPASGPDLINGTIVIRNGLIEAVGANVTAPADAWLVDGKGLHVYPGLIDSLSRWGIPLAAPTPATPTVVAPAGGGGGRLRGGGDEPVNVQFLENGGPEVRPSNTSCVKAADLVQATDRRPAPTPGAGHASSAV